MEGKKETRGPPARHQLNLKPKVDFLSLLVRPGYAGRDERQLDKKKGKKKVGTLLYVYNDDKVELLSCCLLPLFAAFKLQQHHHLVDENEWEIVSTHSVPPIDVTKPFDASVLSFLRLLLLLLVDAL